MNKDLYFIPILLAALESHDPAKALLEGFQHIEQLGRELQHQLGFKQYLLYMEEMLRLHQSDHPRLELILKSKEGFFQSFVLSRETPQILIQQLKLGHYSLSTSSGRLLWEEHLSATDIIWALAFPKQALPMAAETERRAPDYSHEYAVLGGEILVRVLPGLESGSLEIRMNPAVGMP